MKALPTAERPAGRARQEIDDGRRAKGSVYGAFRPATGSAFTASFPRRALEYWITFLEQVDSWVGPDTERIYAVLDNLSMHRATDGLLFCLTHPRWEFVFQPTYAASLNLIEPWWKTLRCLALKGRRFETWQEIVEAVEQATAYWNAHRHPFMWGRRRRHQPHRSPALLWSPLSAVLSGCTT
ncbi:MAG TPA: transposase [Ktedonobacteraceae bacterium]|nr:transposase [Ktedonobacteraceae bacterium]